MAFSNCQSLASVLIPDAVTTIGEEAFSYGKRMKKLTLGNSVEIIDNSAFMHCDSLTQVICKAVTPPSVANGTVFTCHDIATLFVPAEAVEAYIAHEEWGRFTHIVPFIGAGPGDIDGDAEINIADATRLIDKLLSGEELPAYIDVNGDGSVDIADVTSILDSMLGGN